MKKSAVKQEFLIHCHVYVDERISRIHSVIDDLEAALKLETKCSMGDKYETGRAMLHLEFEKLDAQLRQCERLKNILFQINPENKLERVTFGSMVKTDEINYFLSIPAGELQVGNDKFYAVGAGAPIAQSLMDKKVGEEIIFNEKKIKILDIF